MLAITWEQINPVVYLVLGSTLSIGGAVLIERMRAEREDNRFERDRQRENLTTIQDATVELVDLMNEFEDALPDTWERRWAGSLVDDGLRRRVEQAINRYAICTSRVKDQETYDAVFNLGNHAYNLTQASDSETYFEIASEFRRLQPATLKMISELLRTTYA